VIFILPQKDVECMKFFDEAAENWDNICHHDPFIIKNLLTMSEINYKAGRGLDLKVLDVGTGTGVLLPFINAYNYYDNLNIHAVDFSEEMIKKASEKFEKLKNIKFYVCDILDRNSEFFKFNTASYDYIFLYSVFPHFNDPYDIIGNVFELLKDGGCCCIMHSEPKEKINACHDSVSDKNFEYVKLKPSSFYSEILEKIGFYIDKSFDTGNFYFIQARK